MVDAVGSGMSDEVMTLRNVGFRLLFETGEPVTIHTVATHTGYSTSKVQQILASPDLVGRVRRDQEGLLVGIAGLSIESTRHEIRIDGRRLWTWCALDAVGVFNALGASGEVSSTPPDGSDPMTIRFVEGASVSDESLFLLDGFDATNSLETWCPSVNFFPDSDTATAWAKQQNIKGDVVTISQVAEAAGQVWTPVVAG